MPKIVLEQLRFEECKSEKNGYLEIYNLNKEDFRCLDMSMTNGKQCQI